MSAKPHFGVFRRVSPQGRFFKRVADTPADAVSLAFDGWEQVEPATATQKHAEIVAATGSTRDLVADDDAPKQQTKQQQTKTSK